MFSIVKLYRFINKLLEQVLLFEQNCILCGCSCNQQICIDCYWALGRIKNQPYCPRCLLYLPPKEIRCTNCRNNDFQFERIICSYEYAFPLDRILLRLKYQSRLEYSYLLSQLFWAGIMPHLHSLPDVIIPVPLHKNKHKLRGFNQVHELLHEFKQLHPKIRQLNIQRVKETLPQASLNREQRIANLSAAFKLEQRLDGLHVTIIDDVVTSATTINELAKVCREQGARYVDVWCLMRTQSAT